MKIITNPKVNVTGISKFVEHPEYKIPDDGGDLVKIGAFSAKSCYDSYGIDGRPCEENQRAILEHRHGSVLEHIHVSLFIEGVTRGLTLELNRHRTFNISQRSTRYTKEEDSAVVLEPYFAELWRRGGCEWARGTIKFNNSELNSLEEVTLLDHVMSMYDSINAYRHQVEDLMKLNPNNLEGFDLRKWARGKARNVLPHALETRGTWTNNLRGWRWFIEARSSRHAEPEIRRLADYVLERLHGYAPLYFEDFKNAGDYDGIAEWVPTYSKV